MARRFLGIDESVRPGFRIGTHQVCFQARGKLPWNNTCENKWARKPGRARCMCRTMRYETPSLPVDVSPLAVASLESISVSVIMLKVLPYVASFGGSQLAGGGGGRATLAGKNAP